MKTTIVIVNIILAMCLILSASGSSFRRHRTRNPRVMGNGESAVEAFLRPRGSFIRVRHSSYRPYSRRTVYDIPCPKGFAKDRKGQCTVRISCPPGQGLTANNECRPRFDDDIASDATRRYVYNIPCPKGFAKDKKGQCTVRVSCPPGQGLTANNECRPRFDDDIASDATRRYVYDIPCPKGFAKDKKGQCTVRISCPPGQGLTATNECRPRFD